MKLCDIAKELNLENLTLELDLSGAPEISRAYVSDLLSDVMGNAPAGGILVTSKCI